MLQLTRITVFNGDCFYMRQCLGITINTSGKIKIFSVGESDLIGYKLFSF
jgi:hypothetical protein